MPQSAAQLANLRPPFAAGNKVGVSTRRSSEVDQAIREVRKWSPRAVAFLARVMNSEKEATSDRVRCAIALLNKVVPDADIKVQPIATDDTVSSITLKIVRVEHAPPVIEAEAEPEPAPLLSIATVCSGEGDD